MSTLLSKCTLNPDEPKNIYKFFPKFVLLLLRLKRDVSGKIEILLLQPAERFPQNYLHDLIHAILNN